MRQNQRPMIEKPLYLFLQYFMRNQKKITISKFGGDREQSHQKSLRKLSKGKICRDFKMKEGKEISIINYPPQGMVP